MKRTNGIKPNICIHLVHVNKILFVQKYLSLPLAVERRCRANARSSGETAMLPHLFSAVFEQLTDFAENSQIQFYHFPSAFSHEGFRPPKAALKMFFFNFFYFIFYNFFIFNLPYQTGLHQNRIQYHFQNLNHFVGL